MKRAIVTSSVILTLALMGIAVARAGSPDDPKAIPAEPPPCAAEQATAEHKVLAQDEGTWDATLACYMAGPGTTPEVFAGVETNTVIDGGLWVLSDFQGDFAGQPFRGHGQVGFDAKKGKYVGTWVDSMTSRLTIMEGSYDEKTKTLTMLCDGVNPATGQPTKEKHVSEYKGKDARTHTMYILPEGAEGTPIKVMEISYKRRAK